MLVILCGAILYPGTAEGQYCLDQGIDVAGSGAVIDDRRADRQAAVDRRRRWRGDPGFVEIGDNARVHRVGLRAAEAEAGDVEADRRQEFELGRLGDAAFEITREGAGARDDSADCIDAVDLQGEPDLQRAKTARQIGAEIARPGRAGCEAACLAPQVGCRSGEGIAMERAVAHQDEAGVVGHLAPFVKIEGQRIGVLDASKARREIRGEDRKRAVGTIDMQPKLLTPRQLGKAGQIVDRAAIDRAGGADDEERGEAGRAIAARSMR